MLPQSQPVSITVFFVGYFFSSADAGKCTEPSRNRYPTNGYAWYGEDCYACVDWTKRISNDQNLTKKFIIHSGESCPPSLQNPGPMDNVIIIATSPLDKTKCNSYDELINELSTLKPYGIIVSRFSNKTNDRKLNLTEHDGNELIGQINENTTRYLESLQSNLSNNNTNKFELYMEIGSIYISESIIPPQVVYLLILAIGAVVLGCYLNGTRAEREYKEWLEENNATKQQQKEAQNRPKEDDVKRKSSNINPRKIREWSVDEEPYESGNRHLLAANEMVGLMMHVAIVLFVLYYFIKYFFYILLLVFIFLAASSLYQNLKFIPDKFPGKPLPSDLCCVGGNTFAEVAFATLCTALAIFWLLNRNHPYAFFLQNIFSFSMCVLLLRNVRIKKFLPIFIGLVLFAIYDFFMVFVTPIFAAKGSNSVMVEVATGGTLGEILPLVLKSPIPYNYVHICLNAKYKYSILGLGDIMVPGVLVAYNHVWGITEKQTRFYFYFCCILYTIALAGTFVINHVFNTAQPALIYLVPTTLGGTILAALARGEFWDLWKGSLPHGVPLVPPEIDKKIAQAPQQPQQQTAPKTTRTSKTSVNEKKKKNENDKHKKVSSPSVNESMARSAARAPREIS